MEWVSFDSNSFEQMQEAFRRFGKALLDWAKNTIEILEPVMLQFNAAMVPLALSKKDRRGRNLVKGKARRRLKLLYSQYRRGVI